MIKNTCKASDEDTKKKSKTKSKAEASVKSEETSGKVNEKADVCNKIAEETVLKTEYDNLNDKYLRLLAEYDNFKKRTVKEKEAIYIDSVGDTVKEFLPVVDNFERAIASFTDADKETEFYKGVEMIFKQTLDSFAKLGVTQIEALGCEFDPEKHNAVMHIEDETVADNTIVEEFQKGYVYRDKVIRYSMVKVAN